MKKIISIKKINKKIRGNIKITGSKSESNRLIILKQINNNKIKIQNISKSEDTKILKKIFLQKKNNINVNNAGTVMRFLTAYFACKPNTKTILTGSKRMKERPIKILVDSLIKLGAEIKYINKKGYPPIKIIGKKIHGGEINIEANISSQYISAIMLISNTFKKGLKISMINKITSKPYINMTYKILKNIGVDIKFKNDYVKIKPSSLIKTKKNLIESDWSSASYYYSIAAFSNDCKLNLSYYKKNSIQGDSEISKIYKKFFGVKTIYNNKYITLHKKNKHIENKYIKINLNKTPDIAQTIAVTCAGLKIKCFIDGLETLKIKETDRLKALKEELIKIGAKSKITDNSIEIYDFINIKNNFKIKTYEDHRMAMSFAPISMKYLTKIYNPKIVEKSYPDFWKDLKKIGFMIKNESI